jgi:hypothetical protein
VGTAKNFVIPCRGTERSTSSAAKRRYSTTVAPALNAPFMMKFWPNTCDSGRNSGSRSSAVKRA